MTREKAINILDDYDVNFDGHTAEEIAEAFDMAFKALEQEPKVRHCEECKHFRKLPHHADKLGRCLGRCIQHTGLCPKSDWYCADYETERSEEE